MCDIKLWFSLASQCELCYCVVEECFGNSEKSLQQQHMSYCALTAFSCLLEHFSPYFSISNASAPLYFHITFDWHAHCFHKSMEFEGLIVIVIVEDAVNKTGHCVQLTCHS